MGHTSPIQGTRQVLVYTCHFRASFGYLMAQSSAQAKCEVGHSEGRRVLSSACLLDLMVPSMEQGHIRLLDTVLSNKDTTLLGSTTEHLSCVGVCRRFLKTALQRQGDYKGKVVGVLRMPQDTFYHCSRTPKLSTLINPKP